VFRTRAEKPSNNPSRSKPIHVLRNSGKASFPTARPRVSPESSRPTRDLLRNPYHRLRPLLLISATPPPPHRFPSVFVYNILFLFVYCLLVSTHTHTHKHNSNKL
jgi:hypothetical protein